jgi:alpha-ribazole phosphatase/probable phosphoglycerate mutase
MITLDLLRHGEPVGGRLYRGQRDDPLSEQGWQQMYAAIGETRDWDRIISSPLKRCAAFAQRIAQQLKLDLSYVAELTEIGFGVWEGMSVTQIQQQHADALRLFWQDPVKNTPPQAETLAGFNTRVTLALEKIILQHAQERILLVVHAGVIRILLRHVLDFPLKHLLRIQVPYASISRIQIDTEQEPPVFQLVFHAGRL